jgi:hypothetical protein
VAGTGAYFTDSHSGQIKANSGQIKVAISPADGQLNFSNLLPGEFQTKTINYTAHPVGGVEDIWLVFPTDGSAEAFVGHPGDGISDGHGGDGGLGRYGHFALASTGGANFTSYNLNNPGTGSHAGPSCGIDSNGWGGSSVQAASPGDHSVPFCAPANAILLQSGMSAGQSGHVNLEFGYTRVTTGPQATAVSYQIVATQSGIRPDNAFNG